MTLLNSSIKMKVWLNQKKKRRKTNDEFQIKYVRLGISLRGRRRGAEGEGKS